MLQSRFGQISFNNYKIKVFILLITLASRSNKEQLTIILNNILSERNITIPRADYQCEPETCTSQSTRGVFVNFKLVSNHSSREIYYFKDQDE